ncbi:MAG: sulfatase [Acidobacteria bacterium]|nr:sulfatase [Acidobacteriota bacterium]
MRESDNSSSSTSSAAGAASLPAAPAVQNNTSARARPVLPASGTHPNIVFVLTDDLALNLVEYMPHVLEMESKGATFLNYFVTDSLCCPSRSSIFTGRFPHSTGVFKNQGPDGGYQAFVDHGNERNAFSEAFSQAGYRTAMLGKYLNGYEPEQHPPGPGWIEWDVAGNAYFQYNYALNENGKIDRHGRAPRDYLGDVLGELAVRFIKQSRGQPFLIEVATFSPHAPYTPAPRDRAAFPQLQAPRNPAYDAASHDAPSWLRRQPALTDADKQLIDRAFRKRAQSVLAVDKMIADLENAVASIGQEKNTYFIFSSDNGYHMGEYRLMPGKMTAFDSDIHVPLVITGPEVPAGLKIGEIAENIDLNPTLTSLAGLSPMPGVEGLNLVPLIQGHQAPDWRSAALVEHRGPRREPLDPDAPAVRSGNPPSYEALRTRTQLYVEYVNGDREYHDLVSDPWELDNTFRSLSSDQKKKLHRALSTLSSCHTAESCSSAPHR